MNSENPQSDSLRTQKAMKLYKTFDGCIGYKTENVGVCRKPHYNHGYSLKDAITGKVHYYESDQYFEEVHSEELEKIKLIQSVSTENLKMALLLLDERNNTPTKKDVRPSKKPLHERSNQLIKTLL